MEAVALDKTSYDNVAANYVREGFRETEVGIIPNEWMLCCIGDVASVTKLAGFEYTLHFDYSISGPIIAIRGLNIKNGSLDLTEIHTLPSKTSRDLPRSRLSKGDLVMSYVGTIGRVAVIPEDGRFHLAPNVAKISVTSIIHPQFLCQYLNGEIGQKSIFTSAASTTQAAMSMGNLRKIVVPIPSINEQQAIAEALSDADALIEGLEKLIAKKRLIKQGAMQELLTGKRRLPGFSAEWKSVRLSEVAEIRSGGTPSTANPNFWDGAVLWCTPTDITALNGRKYLQDTSRKITNAGLKGSSAEIVPSRSVVMTSRATIGECAINVVPVTTNQGFKNLVPHTETDVEFLYYLMTTQKEQLIALCGGSTFLEIGKTQLTSFEITIPTTQAEQIAISMILAEIDSELEAFTASLTKARQIKQGMMQELLTGRIRLV